MSVQMWRQAWRNVRWNAAWFAGGIGLWGMVILLLYPSVAKSKATALASIPSSVRTIFAVSDLTTLPGFLGGEYLNLVWPLVAAIFAILAGSAVVAQEIERGTAELWLSVPASRASLYWGKVAALLGGAILLTVVSMLGVVTGVALAGESVGAAAVAATALMLAAFVVAIAGVAALASAGSASRGRAGAIAGAVTLGFYLFSIVANMAHGLHWLRYGTIFTLYRPQHAFATGDVEVGRLLLLLAIGAAWAAIGAAVFQRRDVIA